MLGDQPGAFAGLGGGKKRLTLTLPSCACNLEQCLGQLSTGFSRIREQLTEAPVAISFAFPGPADYPAGIIGNLPNFPSFRGGVALGPYLEEKSSASLSLLIMTATFLLMAKLLPAHCRR